MERITLYHRGTPITHHNLSNSSFSIGTHPRNDLVLAGLGISEQHLVLYRGDDHSWRARFGSDKPMDRSGLQLQPGTRLPLGPYTVEVDIIQDDSNQSYGLQSVPAPVSTTSFVGHSPALKLTRLKIAKLAPLKGPVLILGDTGTGKELIARSLHEQSGRTKGPLIVVNCGSLTPSLLEDTLFGHESGAFTGAARNRKGVFEQADGGTLFLDEIGELPLSQQATLLRVLEYGEINRLGSEKSTKVDIRVIAATNLDLAGNVRRGNFRLDLYHRLATLQMQTTPLRDRSEDIEPLSKHFLADLEEELGPRSLTDPAIEKLKTHDWPGNVRELKNVIYRTAALTDCKVLDAGDISLPQSGKQTRKPVPPQGPLAELPNGALEDLLREHSGNVSATAKYLKVSRTTLRDLLDRREINPKALRRPATDEVTCQP